MLFFTPLTLLATLLHLDRLHFASPGLTALTAQAIGAWAIALGFAAAHAFVENTWARARLAFTGNLVFGCLQLVVVLRFVDTIHWSLASAPTYVVGIAAIARLGVYGMVNVPRHALETQPAP